MDNIDNGFVFFIGKLNIPFRFALMIFTIGDLNIKSLSVSPLGYL